MAGPALLRLLLAGGLLLGAAQAALADDVLSWDPRAALERPGCELVVDRADPNAAFASIGAALEAVRPGERICVLSPDHQDERVVVRRSGRPGAPIVIEARAATVTAGFVVEADDVVIAGFTVDNRGRAQPGGRSMGIYLSGHRLAAIGNRVIEPGGYGIGCEREAPSCVDVAILDNTVRRVDGIGIVALGKSILVEGNDVADSRRITAGDADGMRFFGERIRLRGNYIHDISDAGFPEGEEPHTDCFQTFDSDRPSSRDVRIEDNVCVNADHQCLMAEAAVRGESGDLVFARNICANNGSQALLIRDFDGVEITDNIFLPTMTYNAVVLRKGVRNATVRCNLSLGPQALHEIDATSREGLSIAANATARDADALPAARAALSTTAAGPACATQPLARALAVMARGGIEG